MSMLDKLAEVEKRYDDINKQLYDPNVVSNVELYKSLMKENSTLTPIIEKYREYKNAENQHQQAKQMLDEGGLDSEFQELAVLEYDQGRDNMQTCLDELQILLLPRDPNDERNVIIEIRAGAGGEESALFAASLHRMYTMYAEAKGFKTEILNVNQTGLGGYKEISFMIEGDGAYSRYKYESGVHRVQRVPETEAGGRIHTSTATVAVLPEAEEVEIDINPVDLQIDTFRAGGAGGQHVNKTESAVRITHVPSGLVVECQDERSQHKNKDSAMRVLRARLYEKQQQEQQSAIAADRRSQIGTGDRSERIRTYNFPQGRITDHRIGLTLYKIDAIMDGDLDEMVDSLGAADQAEKLQVSTQMAASPNSAAEKA